VDFFRIKFFRDGCVIGHISKENSGKGFILTSLM
jgi:hypothetical protein